jgi:hypothetical protein
MRGKARIVGLPAEHNAQARQRPAVGIWAEAGGPGGPVGCHLLRKASDTPGSQRDAVHIRDAFLLAVTLLSCGKLCIPTLLNLATSLFGCLTCLLG